MKDIGVFFKVVARIQFPFPKLWVFELSTSLAGANSLQAQERKTGWFVGLSPYAMDLNLKKTTRQTTNFSSTGTIVYDATVPNFAFNNTHTIQFGGGGGDNLAVANAAVADAIQLCREGALPNTTVDAGFTDPDTIYLNIYDETTDLTDNLSQLLTNTPTTTVILVRQIVKIFLKQIYLLPLLPLVM